MHVHENRIYKHYYIIRIHEDKMKSKFILINVKGFESYRSYVPRNVRQKCKQSKEKQKHRSHMFKVEEFLIA